MAVPCASPGRCGSNLWVVPSLTESASLKLSGLHFPGVDAYMALIRRFKREGTPM